MSAPTQLEVVDRSAVSLLMFRVADELFALDLATVEEAVELPELHGVPTREHHLLGVVDWRGQLLPVYSPQRVLGLECARDAVTLVVRSGARLVGFAVDDVEDVLELEPSDIRPAPVRGVTEPILVGLVRHHGLLVAVLDPVALVQGCAITSQEDS
ncbi:MAG TPA: chemotaxis protein CheW [Gemmatimonadaceae bacterium]|nr:chemotaxis protein CheW [Gemmatimonadaceae bacterium]